MGYNFGCMIASDTMFDSRDGFSESSEDSRFRGSKGRWNCNRFWLSIYGVHIDATWRIRLNRPWAAAMRPYVKLLWPLVIFVLPFKNLTIEMRLPALPLNLSPCVVRGWQRNEIWTHSLLNPYDIRWLSRQFYWCTCRRITVVISIRRLSTLCVVWGSRMTSCLNDMI